jgi:hypothetical protein
MRDYNWTKGSTPPEERIRTRLLNEYGHLDPDECWIWPGATAGGYGTIVTGSRVDGSRRNKGTHIVMWEAENGPTPEGKELHHRCMTPLCCNPRCLKPVTHQENAILVTEETREKRRDALVEARTVRWA